MLLPWLPKEDKVNVFEEARRPGCPDAEQDEGDDDQHGLAAFSRHGRLIRFLGR